MPGKSAAPAGVAKVYKLSSNENPLGPSPKAIEAVREVAARLEYYPDGAATRLREAIGGDLWPEPGQHRLLERLRRGDRPARADLSCSRATRACSPSTGSSSTRSTSRRPAAFPSSPRKADETADVDAILVEDHRPDPDRLPRQSQQSDRHLCAVRRGAAAACRRCRRMCCWCSTRPMPNMSGATTTRPASNWCPRRGTSS